MRFQVRKPAKHTRSRRSTWRRTEASPIAVSSVTLITDTPTASRSTRVAGYGPPQETGSMCLRPRGPSSVTSPHRKSARTVHLEARRWRACSSPPKNTCCQSTWLREACFGMKMVRLSDTQTLEDLSEDIRKSHREHIDYVSALDRDQLAERIDFAFT